MMTRNILPLLDVADFPLRPTLIRESESSAPPRLLRPVTGTAQLPTDMPTGTCYNLRCLDSLGTALVLMLLWPTNFRVLL